MLPGSRERTSGASRPRAARAPGRSPGQDHPGHPGGWLGAVLPLGHRHPDPTRPRLACGDTCPGLPLPSASPKIAYWPDAFLNPLIPTYRVSFAELYKVRMSWTAHPETQPLAGMYDAAPMLSGLVLTLVIWTLVLVAGK